MEFPEPNTYFYGYKGVSDDVFSDITTADLCQIGQFYEEGPKYRSIGLLETQSPPLLQLDTLFASMDKAVETVIDPKSAVSIPSAQPPCIPNIVMNTNFEVSLPLNSLFAKVKRALKSIDGLEFSPSIENAFEWVAVYVNGASGCKFVVQLYTKCSNVYLIECTRLSGDAITFRSVYVQFHNLLSQHAMLPPVFSGGDVVAIDLDENAGLSAASLDPIVRMGREGTVESQLEAARIFCECSLDNSLSWMLYERQDVIAVLSEIVASSTSEWAKLYAMSALANVVNNGTCQAMLLETTLIPLLFEFATDGPLESTELRRLGVYVLAMLAKSNPERLRAVMSDQLSNWRERVGFIHDPKVHFQACRVIEYLREQTPRN